ncbi:hypothetical protein V1521DRAFT_375301, partial [Lipomyces starkeyi]
VGSTTKHYSDAVYRGRRKEPDGGFIMGLKVGYNEVRAKLHDDKDMLIHGRGVNVVILVFFK